MHDFILLKYANVEIFIIILYIIIHNIILNVILYVCEVYKYIH